MKALKHALIAIFYAAIAAGTVLVLPRFVPSIDLNTAIIIGGTLLVGFALLHEVFARQDEEHRLASELHSLRNDHSDVLSELANARREVGSIQKAIEKSALGQTAKDMADDLTKVATEVKLLQGLVDQLTGAGDQAAAGRQVANLPILAGSPGGNVDDGDMVPGTRPPTETEFDDQEVLEFIQDALREDGVELYLQPIVSLPQRKRKFYEAFTRIRDRDGKIVRPDHFIWVAEREGLITAIDNMLLFRCVQLLREAQKRNHNISFFCNISPYTLADQAFFRDFLEFMNENKELAANLVFEFAHSTIANEDDEIRHHLTRLANMGFRFSLDQVNSLNLDFGRLGRDHFRFVKIEADKIIAEFENPGGDTDIEIQDLKRTLERQGIDLIVEKIESESGLLDVLDLEVDFGQGYLFGEPQRSQLA